MKDKTSHLITTKYIIKCHLPVAFSLLLFSFVLCSDPELQVLKNTSNEDMNVDFNNDDILVTTEINDLSSVTEREQTNGNDSIKLDKPFLLPLSIKPLHYKLEVIPLLFDLDADNVESLYYNASRFTAPGKVWIQFFCLTETTNVTLHAFKDMKIETEKITVTNIKTEKTIVINNVTRDNDTDFLVLHLAHSIGGESGGDIFSVFIEFTARIADDRLNGLYLDYYVHPETKEKRYLSTTLFAPNHARKAFPCFDEPGLKANFSIFIGRKNGSGYSSISNMPLLRTKPIPELRGWVLDEFDETIPLPTYLVAIITTDFKFRKIQDGNLELRLHAPEHLLKRTKSIDVPSLNDTSHFKSPNPYLLQDPLRFIAASLKMWQGTKLGLLPLSKMDIIALPHFYFNAMENMGAITFKYPVILNVENVTTTRELLRLSFVAGHEVVHQWFGNLLTPKSWTYVWLKEGFSDLFSRLYLSEKVNVGYKHEDIVNSELQRALRFDGGPDTHPLENHVKTASAVGEIYTDIPYRKGASILNMVRVFLSDSIFKQGLESLFVEKKYSNIDQNDLFSHLQSVQQKYHVLKLQGLDGNTTITDILNTWTQQCGYPVVRIKRKGSILILKQEKFQNKLVQTLKLIENETKILDENLVLSDEMENTDINATKEERWWIPISIFKHEEIYNKRAYSIKWLRPNDNLTEIQLGRFHSITNVEGYFRILYGKAELHSILKGFIRESFSGKHGVNVESNYIDFPPMQPVERSQFLDDYFTFAFSKYEEVPISLLFHIVSVTLPHEYEYVVWRTFFQNMWKPYQLFQNTEYFPSLQKYLSRLLRPLNTFLESQKQAIMSAPCFHSTAFIRKMYFSQFSSLIFSWICAVDSESCAELATKHVHSFIETGDISIIPADFQETMYCAAVKYAKQEDLPYLWSSFEKLYFTEFYPVQRDRYLNALSCTRNITYLEILLTWTTNETHDFHDIDRVALLKNVIANPEGRGLILDFLDRNFDILYKSDSVANPVTEALRAFVDYVNAPDQLQEMETFISSHADEMEKKKKFLEKQVKKAKLNISWMETFAENIRESVDHHSQNKFGKNNREKCFHESLSDFEDYVSQITDWE